MNRILYIIILFKSYFHVNQEYTTNDYYYDHILFNNYVYRLWILIDELITYKNYENISYDPKINLKIDDEKNLSIFPNFNK